MCIYCILYHVYNRSPFSQFSQWRQFLDLRCVLLQNQHVPTPNAPTKPRLESRFCNKTID